MDRFPRLRLLDATGARGQSHARNAAAAAASGDQLLFTDQDDIVPPDWIALLTDGLTRSQIVTGPVAHFVDGQPAAFDPRGQPAPLSTGPFTYLFGCNMGIGRDVFLDLGGFDETATFGWEDIDLGIRASLRGLTPTWLEQAVVLHRRPGTIRMTWRKEFRYGRGWTMLERRYPGISPDGWLGPTLRRAGWVAVRTPYLAFPKRRRVWVGKAAAIAGRFFERLRPSA
jgi:GT2 family glycosyltransferase